MKVLVGKGWILDDVRLCNLYWEYSRTEMCILDWFWHEIIILPSSTSGRWTEPLLMSCIWRSIHITVDTWIIILVHPWHFKQHRICHPVLGLLWVAWRILHIWCSWWTQTFPTLWVTLKRCWKQHVQVRLSSMSGAVIYPPCRWRFLSVQLTFPECNRFFCVEHFVIYWDEFIKFDVWIYKNYCILIGRFYPNAFFCLGSCHWWWSDIFNLRCQKLWLSGHSLLDNRLRSSSSMKGIDNTNLSTINGVLKPSAQHTLWSDNTSQTRSIVERVCLLFY